LCCLLWSIRVQAPKLCCCAHLAVENYVFLVGADSLIVPFFVFQSRVLVFGCVHNNNNSHSQQRRTGNVRPAHGTQGCDPRRRRGRVPTARHTTGMDERRRRRVADCSGRRTGRVTVRRRHGRPMPGRARGVVQRYHFQIVVPRESVARRRLCAAPCGSMGSMTICPAFLALAVKVHAVQCTVMGPDQPGTLVNVAHSGSQRYKLEYVYIICMIYPICAHSRIFFMVSFANFDRI
jgi:hypothetical protein